MSEGGEFCEFLVVSAGELAPSSSLQEESYLQRLSHLIEGAFGLVKKPVDNALAEISIFVVVHLQDLLKC